jgi:hypothetical protein
MTPCSPLAFERACARIRALYEDDPDLALRLSDLADVTQMSSALCATATASLVNGGVLKWTTTHALIRADAKEATERRRTA